MPIAVKDYTWEQSEDTVFITVPLKGVLPKNVDILSTETYVKISYPPYIFECFLCARVLDDQCAVQIGDGAAVFKLKKEQQGLWESLQCPEAVDKTKQRELRDQALTRYRERIEEQKKLQSDVKCELSKFAVQQQMKLEQADRQRIDDVKESERKQATEELERWKERQRLQALKEKERLVRERYGNGEVEKNKTCDLKKTDAKTSHRTTAPESIFQELDADGCKAPLRQSGTISVSFTPREFPTPTRESLAAEENEWLSKQAETRRVIELEDKDLTDEERNPIWMRDKGNSFFQAGNYQAAINAYSHGIRLNSKMPSLYSNRAACHLKLGNLFKSMEDSSKALELLTPAVEQNKDARLKAHVRRGTALCRLEMYVEGLMDYEVALKLDPNNEQLKIDMDKIRQVIQSSKA